MVSSNKFQSNPQAVASYSYTQFADRTGYINFYGFSSINNTTYDHHLSVTQPFSSKVTENTKTQPGGTFSKVLDVDFDIRFNYPIMVRGDILTSISFALATVGNSECYCVIKVYHYDGTTETQLGSDQQTETLSLSGAGSLVKDAATNTLVNNITPKLFAEGDILRLTVELWAKWSGLSGTYFAGFGTSPTNTTDPDGYITTANGAQATSLIIQVPTLIDL